MNVDELKELRKDDHAIDGDHQLYRVMADPIVDQFEGEELVTVPIAFVPNPAYRIILTESTCSRWVARPSRIVRWIWFRNYSTGKFGIEFVDHAANHSIIRQKEKLYDQAPVWSVHRLVHAAQNLDGWHATIDRTELGFAICLQKD